MDAASQLARLKAFRASTYRSFTRRPDALMNLLDAISSTGLVPSFAHLSLHTPFERGHGSLYAALNHGRLDLTRLHKLLGTTVDRSIPPVFAIDTTTWVRNDAATSPERTYSYHHSRHSAGKPVVTGWTYSFIAQLGAVSSSWTAPLDVQRVSPGLTVHQVLDAHIQHVTQALSGTATVPLFVFDGGYDPVRLAKLQHADDIAVLVRVRRNRCFYFDVPKYSGPRGGRPRIHGAKFSCDDPRTWPAPQLELNEHTERYGFVRVRAWSGLHGKSQQDARPGSRHFKVTYSGTVLLLEVSKLPRETCEPQAFWLWWRGPGVPDLAMLWRAYTRRFDLEHSFRFLKQTLNWDKPRVRTPEQADRWTWLVVLAFSQLRLARGVLEDARLPWQRPQVPGRLTPSRVRQGFARLLPSLGSPACSPKPCGRSPGRPKGRVSGRAPRFPVYRRAG